MEAPLGAVAPVNPFADRLTKAAQFNDVIELSFVVAEFTISQVFFKPF